MKNFFRFQLSTLFLVMTVVAVALGIKIGLMELVESTSTIQKLFRRIFSYYIWIDIPLYVVFALGIKWIWKSKNINQLTKKLALAALITIFSWQALISPSVTMLVAAADVAAVTQVKLAGWMGVLSQLIHACCWLMMILALLVQSEPVEPQQ